MEKMILAGCLLLIGLTPLAFSQPVKDVTSAPVSAKIPTGKSKISAEPASAALANPAADAAKAQTAFEDTVPKNGEKGEKPSVMVKKDEEIVYERDGYRIVTHEGRIRTAYYNGKKLTAEEIKKQKPQLDKVIKMQALEWRNMKQAADQDYVKMLAEKRMMQEEISQASVQALQSREMAEVLALKASRIGEVEQVKLNEINQQMEELKQQLAELQTQRTNLEIENSKAILEKMSKDQWPQGSPEAFNPIGQIIDKLIEKKIITNRAELSFELNSDGFTVNNVKQPSAIHEEFKKEFLKGQKDHISYSISKHSSHAETSISD